MTLGKHLSIMTPTRPFAVTCYGITVNYDSADRVPNRILNAELRRVEKNKATGQLIYELEEEE